ncbi:MAG: hypothetical protein ABEJ99_04670 [Candidatus Nanohaloarchaea archaeon]
MERRHKIDIITGLTLSGVFATVLQVYGPSRITFMAMSYGYIFMGLFAVGKDLLLSEGVPSVNDFIVIVDREERVMKQLFTGKKYRLEGDLEKIGQ